MSILLVHFLLFVSPVFQDRAILAANASIERNSQGTVFIEVDARGDENTFGTSINFDPAELVLIGAALAPGAPSGSSLIVNSSQRANGHLGIVVSMPIGQSVAAGRVRLAALTFHARAEGLAPSTSITFGDLPLARQVVKADATAIPLSSLAFVSGSVTLTRTATIVSSASYLPGSAGRAFVNSLGIRSSSRYERSRSVDSSAAITTRRYTGSRQGRCRRRSSSSALLRRSVPGKLRGPGGNEHWSGDGDGSCRRWCRINRQHKRLIGLSCILHGELEWNWRAQLAQHIDIRSGALISEEPIATWNGATYITRAIDLGPDTDQVFLVLYGTGFRFNTGLSGIQASLAGRAITTGYAGAQGYYVGEDQVNLGPLPRTLSSAGTTNLSVIVDGKPANVVTVEIK